MKLGENEEEIKRNDRHTSRLCDLWDRIHAMLDPLSVICLYIDFLSASWPHHRLRPRHRLHGTYHYCFLFSVVKFSGKMKIPFWRRSGRRRLCPVILIFCTRRRLWALKSILWGGHGLFLALGFSSVASQLVVFRLYWCSYRSPFPHKWQNQTLIWNPKLRINQIAKTQVSHAVRLI